VTAWKLFETQRAINILVIIQEQDQELWALNDYYEDVFFSICRKRTSAENCRRGTQSSVNDIFEGATATSWSVLAPLFKLSPSLIFLV
jgi:hypothetical protein